MISKPATIDRLSVANILVAARNYLPTHRRNITPYAASCMLANIDIKIPLAESRDRKRRRNVRPNSNNGKGPL